MLQAIILGVTILQDKHPKPVFPRWLAYLENVRAGLAAAHSWVAPTAAFGDVIRALYRSIVEGRPVRLDPFAKATRPTLEQERSAPAARGEPPTVNVQPES